MRKILTNFRGGEVSDRVAGRMDSADYDQTCRTLENFLLHPSGGADLRPGTYYCGAAKTNTGIVRLVPFVRSKTEAYVLELSNLLIRVWKDGVLVQSGGSDLEIVAPWAEADLFALKYAQTEDAIYFTHPDYQPVKLKYYASTAWSLNDADFSILLGVAHDTSPYVSIYGYSGDTYGKKTDPGDLPTGAGNDCAFSSDGVYFAVAHNTSPYITIYKRSGETFTKLDNPAILPAGTGNCCAFSHDNVYLAVGHPTSPYVTVYKRSGDTFTKVSGALFSELPAGEVVGCTWGIGGGFIFLAVAHNTSPYITIYQQDIDYFGKLSNPDILPTGIGRGCAFSHDGLYLSVAHSTSPYVTIYRRSELAFSKLSDPADLPVGTAQGCVFSPNGVYLAVVHTTTPFVTIYIRSGDIFTKLANPATLPAGNGVECSFSPDSFYLAVAHDTSPYVTIYKRAANTFTKIADPSVLPTGAGYGCAFTPDGWQNIPWGMSYPQALTFHEQRLIMGRGRILYASRIGVPQDFAVDVTDASFGYEYKFAANQLEDVLWMLTKNHYIILGSGMGEWLMTGGDAPLTAANVYVDRVSAHGSANIAAIMANESILFVQDGSQRLREFLYSQERGGYISPDLSRWADHIGRKNFVEMAWQRSPASLLWGVRGNGELAALTLDRNVGIQAWHRHPTDGEVESVAVIPGVAEDVVYMVVKRSLDDINLLDHADCESTDAPHITGDGASVSNCTFARSSDFAYAGVYSYKLTRTIPTGGAHSLARMTDNVNTTDLHELIPGNIYQFSANVYIPTTGGPTVASEVWIQLAYYDSGEWTNNVHIASVKNDWEFLEIAETKIPATATGIQLNIAFSNNAENGEYFYVDNLKLTQVNPGGNPKKYIEYLKPIDWGDDEEDCFLVDCGKTVDHSATNDSIEGATDDEPVVITATAHPFANDEFVKITGVVGMTELNGNTYMVKNKAANTFELYETDGTTPLDGTGFTAYVSGGTCVKVVKVVPGLTHLEGETLAVYADGVELGDEEVYVGSITIDEYASKIHVGLPYTGKLKPQRLGQLLTSKVQETVLMLYKTRGGKIGSNVNNLNAIQHASSALLTGPVDARIQGTFSREGDLLIVQDQPLPMTVLAIAADAEAN